MHAPFEGLPSPSSKLRVATAVDFVDIGRQFADSIAEFDEFRASATARQRLRGEAFGGIAIDLGDLRWLDGGHFGFLRDSSAGRHRAQICLFYPVPTFAPKPAPASATKAAWPVEECQCGLAETQ
jgi:hypothetical protein